MKYPEGTESKTVTGKQAKKQLEAIAAGKGLITEKGRKLAERLRIQRLRQIQRKLLENGKTQG